MPAQDLDSAVKKLMETGASDEDIIFFMKNYKSEPELKGEQSIAPLPTFEATGSVVPPKEKKKPLGFRSHLTNIAANIVAPGPLQTRINNVIKPFVEPELPWMVPQLAEEEEGILNPNISMNPLGLGRNPISRTVTETLSKPFEHPTLKQYQIKPLRDFGEQLLTESLSPLGIASMFMGASPAEHPPLRPSLRIPPRALLPEQAGPSSTGQINPRFIAGMEGVAENRPYSFDPTNVPDLRSGSGTILDSEILPKIQVPPELAAQGMTGAGHPITAKPIRINLQGKTREELDIIGKEILTWTEQGYTIKNAGNNQLDIVPPTQPIPVRNHGRFTGQTTKEPFLGEGTARPGEPQLPSAPIKPSRFITPEAQAVADTPPPPLVSPITGEPASNIVSAVRSGNPKTSRTKNVKQGEVPRQNTIAKLIDALFEARPIRAQQEKIYSAERGKRFERFENVKKKGEEGAFARLRKLRGELPKLQFESIRPKLDQPDIDTLFDIINQSAISSGEKARGITGLAKLLGEYGGHVPQNNEINILMRVFGNAFGDDAGQAFLKGVRSNMSRAQRTSGLVTNISDFRKSLMASMDVSFPFRQGLPYIYKGEWWRAWGDMFRAWGRWDSKGNNSGKQFFKDFQDSIRSDPDYALADRVGLEILEREEIHASQIAERIPGVGASSRAYNTFAWKLRFDVFKDQVRKMENIFPDIRKNEDALRALANYINTSTGRGSLGKFAGATDNLNKVFFSPSLMFSRGRMLGMDILGGDYYKINPLKISPSDFTPEMNYIRWEKLKAILSIGSMGLSLAALGKAGGANVSLDSRSSDFLKVRVGNTRVDMLGGFQQYVVLMSRLQPFTSPPGRTSSITGKELEYAGRYGYPNVEQAIMDFLYNKAAPEFGQLWLAARQKGPQGEAINWNQEQWNRSMPILVQDLWEIIQEDPNLIPFSLPAAVGMGVQTYGAQEPREKYRPFRQ